LGAGPVVAAPLLAADVVLKHQVTEVAAGGDVVGLVSLERRPTGLDPQHHQGQQEDPDSHQRVQPNAARRAVWQMVRWSALIRRARHDATRIPEPASQRPVLWLTEAAGVDDSQSMSVPPRSRNSDVARLLEEIGDLLEIKGDQSFRVNTY